MRLKLKLAQVYRSEGAWRAVDAFSPRVLALFLHTAALAAFGSAGYAVIAWVTSAFALSYSLIPDPHSYILVRRHGKGALRLGSIVTPVILAKGLFCTAVAGLSAYYLLAPELQASAGAALPYYLLAGLIYGLSEAWWSYAGVIGLAAEQLRKTAQLGVLFRLLGLGLMGGACALGLRNPAVLAVLYCSPLLLLLLFLMPCSWNVKRGLVFYSHGVRRYALWSQGIGLSTGWLGQLVPLVAGLTPGISPHDMGVISYVTRVLGAAMTPLQVLQSLIIKLVAQCKDPRAPKVLRYDYWFKLATIVLTVAYSIGLLVGHLHYHLSVELCLGLALQGTGLFTVSWHRVALTSLMASQKAKPLFLVGYLPVLVISTALAWPVAQFSGVLGLSVLSLVGWVYIAFSWQLPLLRHKTN